MSRSKTSSNPLKRFWNLLFKPSLPLYQDEPKRPSTLRKKATGESHAKAGTKPHPQTKKKSKKKNSDLATMSSQELGERIGFIDKNGVVKLKATSTEVGRLSAEQLQSPDTALGDFVDLFKSYESQLLAIKAQSTALTPDDLAKVAHLRTEIAVSPGLGDVRKLHDLLGQIDSQVALGSSQIRAEKVKLLQQIDKLPTPLDNGEIDWTGADKQLAAFTEAWRKTAVLDEKAQASLEHRFEATLRAFKDRKYKFYNDFEGNKALKERLIRQAENLTTADNVESAKATFDKLSKAWRSIGEVEKGEEVVLLERLEQAKRDFTIANAEKLAEQEERRGHLMTRRSEMSLELDGLIMSDDPKELGAAIFRHTNTLEQIQRHLGRDDQTQDLEVKLEALRQKADLLNSKLAGVRKAQIDEANSMLVRLPILSKASDHQLSWKDAEKELSNFQSSAKSMRVLPKELKTKLSSALSDASKDLIANRTAYFEKMDAEREVNAARKLALINDLPFYKNGATSAELSAHLNSSMEAWKKVGPAGRDVNDQLWDQYREVRESLFARVKELRELEKNDFAERLAAAFARKRDALKVLEVELSQDEMLLENLTDKKKIGKIKSAVAKQKKRISELQSDILDIQRKLAKMSSAKRTNVPTKSEIEPTPVTKTEKAEASAETV